MEEIACLYGIHIIDTDQAWQRNLVDERKKNIAQLNP
jgi:hypothetical protein